jgi:hypothetical protein
MINWTSLIFHLFYEQCHVTSFTFINKFIVWIFIIMINIIIDDSAIDQQTFSCFFLLFRWNSYKECIEDIWDLHNKSKQMLKIKIREFFISVGIPWKNKRLFDFVRLHVTLYFNRLWMIFKFLIVFYFFPLIIIEILLLLNIILKFIFLFRMISIFKLLIMLIIFIIINKILLIFLLWVWVIIWLSIVLMDWMWLFVIVLVWLHF